MITVIKNIDAFINIFPYKQIFTEVNSIKEQVPSISHSIICAFLINNFIARLAVIINKICLRLI